MFVKSNSFRVLFFLVTVLATYLFLDMNSADLFFRRRSFNINVQNCPITSISKHQLLPYLLSGDIAKKYRLSILYIRFEENQFSVKGSIDVKGKQLLEHMVSSSFQGLCKSAGGLFEQYLSIIRSEIARMRLLMNVTPSKHFLYEKKVRIYKKEREAVEQCMLKETVSSSCEKYIFQTDDQEEDKAVSVAFSWDKEAVIFQTGSRKVVALVFFSVFIALVFFFGGGLLVGNWRRIYSYIFERRGKH